MGNTSVDTLIFDLDNTLIDRNEALRLTVNNWLTEQGIAPSQIAPALDDIMRYDDWGYTDRTEFCNWLLQHYRGSKSNGITAPEFQYWLLKNIPFNVAPNPSANEALRIVQSKYRLVLATNGSGVNQRNKLDKAQLLPFFKAEDIFISGELGVDKPDPLFYTKIIERLQLDTNTAMMIGDNPVNDIQSAHSVGLQTCWVSYNRPAPADLNASKVITYITEITQWL